jgi:hypothetical protein
MFAPHFRGSSWTPWKSALAALFGLKMTDEQATPLRVSRHPPRPPRFPAALPAGSGTPPNQETHPHEAHGGQGDEDDQGS